MYTDILPDELISPLMSLGMKVISSQDSIDALLYDGDESTYPTTYGEALDFILKNLGYYVVIEPYWDLVDYFISQDCFDWTIFQPNTSSPFGYGTSQGWDKAFQDALTYICSKKGGS